MQRSTLRLSVAALALAASALVAAGAPAQAQDRERLISRDLMTPEERADYLIRLRAATTADEREQIRLDAERLMETRTRGPDATSPDPPRPGAGPGLSGAPSGTRGGLGEERSGMERGMSGGQGSGGAESNASGPLRDLGTPGAGSPASRAGPIPLGGGAAGGLSGGAAGGGGMGGGSGGGS